MKNAIFAVMAIFLLVAASDRFGEKVTKKGAISIEEMVEKMGDKSSMEVKVKGEVLAVCKVKGCWMTMELPNGESMRITFKDYGFFVPKDCSGRTAFVEGVVKRTTVSVEDQRHYAKDGGATDEEIAKITEPKEQITFVADGVLLK